MHLIEDDEDDGMVMIACTEAEVRFLNNPGGMLALSDRSTQDRVVWFYTPGSGAVLRIQEMEICELLRLTPQSHPERRLLQLLWGSIKNETVKKQFSCE